MEDPCHHLREAQTSRIHLHHQNLLRVLEGNLTEVFKFPIDPQAYKVV